MKSTHQNILKDIKESGNLSDENKTKMGDILNGWLPQSGLKLRA